MYDKNNTEQLYAKQKYFAVQIISLGLKNGLTFFKIYLFSENWWVINDYRYVISRLDLNQVKFFDKNAFLGEKTKVKSQNSKLSSMKTFFFSKK